MYRRIRISIKMLHGLRVDLRVERIRAVTAKEDQRCRELSLASILVVVRRWAAALPWAVVHPSAVAGLRFSKFFFFDPDRLFGPSSG